MYPRPNVPLLPTRAALTVPKASCTLKSGTRAGAPIGRSTAGRRGGGAAGGAGDSALAGLQLQPRPAPAPRSLSAGRGPARRAGGFTPPRTKRPRPARPPPPSVPPCLPPPRRGGSDPPLSLSTSAAAPGGPRGASGRAAVRVGGKWSDSGIGQSAVLGRARRHLPLPPRRCRRARAAGPRR